MKKFIYPLIVVVLILVIGFLIFRSSKADTTTNTPDTTATTNTTNSQPSSIVSGDLSMTGAIATIYYGDGCPHCSVVEKWLQDNKFLPAGAKVNQSAVDPWISGAKVKFNMKEVWSNKTNSAELTSVATSLGLTSQQTGVPFLYDSVNKKSYIGETDVENFFSSQIK